MQQSKLLSLVLLAFSIAATSCGGGGGGSSSAPAAANVSNAIADTTVVGDASGTGATGASSPTPGSTPTSSTPTPASTPAPPGSTPSPPSVPVGLRLVEVATDLNSPWGMAFLPDGHMLITERGGQLRLRKADGTPESGVNDFISGVPAVLVAGQGGLLDVAVDPAFATNRRIYLSFAQGSATLNGTAVARAELNLATRTLENVTVIFQQLPKVDSTAHFGSRLVFDRNGYLYVTLGERLTNEQRVFAQDLTRGNGKVMRITTDGAPAPGNPFAATPGAQAAIWSYGHRNPQGAAIHPATGELWVSEHGPQGGDEINRVLPGHNYGWPVISYGQEYGTTTQVGEGTAKAGMDPPLTYWEKIDGSAWTGGTKSSIAPSGIAFYNADNIPQWKGNLFVAALAGTALWRLTVDGNSVTARERLLADRGERIRDVEQGPDGWLYVLTDGTPAKLLRYQN
ncbi:PQQ-dependent sugar dehydrogenase [Variovorax sp. J22R133]|uniref:PQQ-dependent sugar dehydrogenase n=1 Tax=Variovorax brevis TaxID=3053503 RepID=UPI0025766613|nr:PQQ-dependent sugar dehydrogenase [Variovorax sp. J22R133]MDM0111943.1 PQQ-dependent sugar dehydrogenase [Variovorax sp. J22R133]